MALMASIGVFSVKLQTPPGMAQSVKLGCQTMVKPVFCSSASAA